MIQSADTANEQAGVVMNQVQTVATAAAAATTALQKKLVAMSDDDFARLCADSAFTTIAFNLTELRQHGQELLDDASEALINNLPSTASKAGATTMICCPVSSASPCRRQRAVGGPNAKPLRI